MRRALADARRNTSLALVFLVVLATTIGLASRGETKLIPGSKNPKNDCLIEADIDGVTGRGPQVTCTDGDRCDHDGSCPNRSCRFRIRACIDQTNVPGCSGGPIGKARAFVKVGKRKTMLPLPPTGAAWAAASRNPPNGLCARWRCRPQGEGEEGRLRQHRARLRPARRELPGADGRPDRA